MTAPGIEDIAVLRDAVHARDDEYAVPSAITWPDGARVAVNLTVDFDAMLLRRALSEPPMQIAKGEFGGRVGIWRLIELFDSHDVKATFFTPGRICELYPDSLRALVASGHEIGDHMWEHRMPAEPEVQRAHLARSTEALQRVTGQRPVGTRSGYSPELLAEYGYLYNSHGAADTLPYRLKTATGAPFVNLPFHFAWDDAMYFNFAWVNTENAAQRMADPDRILEFWWDAFYDQYSHGGYVNICLHPEFSGRALRIRMLDELITRMRKLPGVWLSSCGDVVRHCLSEGI